MDDTAQNPPVSSPNPAPSMSSEPPVSTAISQNQNVAPEPVVSAEPIIAPEQTPAAPPPAPVAPIGGMHKEAGPMVSVEAPMAEVLQPSEKAPELEAEVIEAGVEVPKNPEVPDLTLHDKHAGVSHAPVIAPVPTQPTDGVQLPMTETQALETLKTSKNPKNSKSWLAIEVLKMLHRKLIGGEHP